LKDCRNCKNASADFAGGRGSFGEQLGLDPSILADTTSSSAPAGGQRCA
jgi:hypothetical protein